MSNRNETVVPYKNPRVMFAFLCGLSLLFFECVYEIEGLGGTQSTPGNMLFRPELTVTPP
jgi:hypothetical protein